MTPVTRYSPARTRLTPRQFSVRTATPADAEALAALCAQARHCISAEEVAADLASITQHGGIVLVAVDAGEHVIALLHMTAHHRLGMPALAEICGLFVDHSARGEHIGTTLLATAERWARNRDLHEIVVNNALVRDDALAFYCRSGYAPVRDYLQFRK